MSFHIAVVIPTFDRHVKLNRCIWSILNQTHQDFNIYVMADNDDKGTDDFMHDAFKYHMDGKIKCIRNGERGYVIGCWNWFMKNNFRLIRDTMAWIVDDVELHPDCFEKAVKCFKENFSGRDGVVGINQYCPGYDKYAGKPYGQVLLGKEFIARYPDNQVCCPDYTHFYQDEEMYNYATSLKKFAFCEEALLKHWHPAHHEIEKDFVHKHIRGDIVEHDRDTKILRRGNHFNWGNDFNLVNKKKEV